MFTNNTKSKLNTQFNSTNNKIQSPKQTPTNNFQVAIANKQPPSAIQP